MLFRRQYHPLVSDTRQERARISLLCQTAGLVAYDAESASNVLCYSVQNEKRLLEFAHHLESENFIFTTLVANDEYGMSSEYRFCLYHIFSHRSADIFLSVAYPLPTNEETYPSMQPYFAGVEPFEQEIATLMGLMPSNRPTPREGLLVHRSRILPDHIYPLRRDLSLEEIREAVLVNSATVRPATHDSAPNVGSTQQPSNDVLVPVGPITSKVIEAGRFTFDLNHEIVRCLSIRQGDTHRGIERLFAEYFITDRRSVNLAERVVHDSAFAHSLAFCRAVERLTDSEIPRAGQLIRAVLLELERVKIHIDDIAALAHALGRDAIASELGVLQERLRHVCEVTVGHRFLLGVNVPGGAVVPHPFNSKLIRHTVAKITREFCRACASLDDWRFRQRTQGIGILDRAAARRLGVTGLVARSSGVDVDYRLLHPDLIPQPLMLRALGSSQRVYAADGDVYSRYCERVHQVMLSSRLLAALLSPWNASWRRQDYFKELALPSMLRRRVSLGYSEGGRGNIVYWLAVDDDGRIVRCKVRDPSMLNIPALAEASRDNLLSDFPIISNSFNLSYSGNDL